MRISNKAIETTVELIKSNISYRRIIETVPEIKSTSMITRIKKIYINGEKPKKRGMSERTKMKMQKTAFERKYIQKSDIIINNYINILEGFKYSIKNLEDIHNKHKDNSNDLLIELQKLNANVVNLEFDDIGREELLDKIHNSITKVSDIFKHSDRRIKAIEGLRKQIETFIRFKVNVEALMQVKELIDSFLEGCSALPDEWYFKYKEAVTRNNIFAREFFSKYEGFYGAEEIIIQEKEDLDKPEP